MAKALKDFFDSTIVREIGEDITRVHPAFDAKGFARRCVRGLDDLELTERAKHVADALKEHLPEAFPKAASILTASLRPELKGPNPSDLDSPSLDPFRYFPHSFFVAKYGLDHFEPSMQLQYEMTKRFTAEFSIRPFLERYPEATYTRLVTWAEDKNVHVRRLVSEGTRPRLPWAPRLRAFQKDPSPVLALLERLKDDPELYVRRSVANNLNDIGKDHPELLADVCRRWSKGAGEGRTWLIRHALRSLVKKGDTKALAVLGFAAAPAVRLEAATFSPARVRAGGVARFSFEMVSTGRESQDLLVDYAVHFVKANGKTAAKVFKLRKVTLPGRGRVSLEGKISFEVMTTRRHYPGVHRVDILVNGTAFPVGEVAVLP